MTVHRFPKFPGIHRAAFLIAIDNGGIYRGRSEEQQARDTAQFLAGRIEPLEEIDRWLADLSDDELNEFCNGDRESDEFVSLMQRNPPPPFTDTLLDDYFEEVC